MSSMNLDLQTVAIHTGLYSFASVVSANPIGLVGGAIFGAVRAASTSGFTQLDRSSREKGDLSFRADRIAIIFFASQVTAAATLIALGFSAALMNIASLSLVGLGCLATYKQVVNFIDPGF